MSLQFPCMFKEHNQIATCSSKSPVVTTPFSPNFKSELLGTVESLIFTNVSTLTPHFRMSELLCCELKPVTKCERSDQFPPFFKPVVGYVRMLMGTYIFKENHWTARFTIEAQHYCEQLTTV
ncbi:UNVERIFIED_CONTAM: hypothetical protein K2H54_065777 [Gekko kuhli]